MHRALTVAVVLAVVAGSVPAAASLADGTPSTIEPGASFAGVVGVQEAEVDSEVANRSLNQRLAAAETNSSKANVVAGESRQLADRLDELEAEKARLKAAYENGSISKGQYTAQLAVLGAELRALERQANRTAGVAETLPPEALREHGANVSEVRNISERANRTGGGEVAEAAREIAGEGVGDGLGKPANPGQSANATDRGQSGEREQGKPTDAGNESTGKPAEAGQSSGAENTPPSDAGNGNDPANASDGSENATGTNAGNGAENKSTAGASDARNRTERGADGDGGNASATTEDAANRPDDAGTGDGAAANNTTASNTTANGRSSNASNQSMVTGTAGFDSPDSEGSPAPDTGSDYELLSRTAL